MNAYIICISGDMYIVEKTVFFLFRLFPTILKDRRL